MKRFLNFVLKINFKTFYFNFKYLPLKQAVKLPIFISRKVYLKNSSGKIIIDAIAIRTGLIQFGYGEVGIFDNKKSRSIWDVSGIVIFKGICRIGHGSKISVGKNGKLTLGNNFVISAETSIVSHMEIVFGNNCLLSWDILIMDTDFHKIKDKQENIINAPKPIIIGENVWVGCRCLILKGTIIANHSVIGANSIVSKSLEYSHGLYAGNPCKLIKENISWEE
ncbi:MAG: acyltransferase [Arachidicoccus sp.]|nr:acyltransferase [Arachidicoccus sp.]